MFKIKNTEGSEDTIVVRKSKECFLVELVKRYSYVRDLVLFELQHVDHFCLKLFKLFSAEGMRG